jgi:hypothetical protein
MCNTYHQYEQLGVVDLVDDAVVADPDTPEPLFIGEGLDAWRTRVDSESDGLAQDASS